MNFHKVSLVAFALILFCYTHAQTTQSTYSNFGLGEFMYQGLPQNYGMGEAGLAVVTPWHMNLQNPAGLGYNALSTFQVGLSGDIRSFENTLDSYTAYSGSLRFLAMSFPVVKNRWTSAFALLPFTYANFNTFSQDSIDVGVTSRTQFQGKGGLTQFMWANGFRLFKGFHVGVKAGYVFGTLTDNSNVQVVSDDFASNYKISYSKESYYKDIYASVGLHYRQKVGEKFFLNLGMTYDLSKSIDGTRDEYLKRLSSGGSTLVSTILQSDVPVSVNLPATVGLGFCFEKVNAFKLAADYTNSAWSEANGDASLNVRNTKSMAVGTEWIPDIQSINNYFNRVTYRLGFNYKELPYLVNNSNINDFGINFGASFPVSGVSSFDTGFKFGQRGTTDNNLIKEKYFQIVIGATINDKWFRPVLYN